MTRASRGLAVLAVAALASGVCVWPESTTVAAANDPPPAPKAADPALTGSAIEALLKANNGKVPATGEELWQALSKIDKFAQLPVVYSAVRLDSGIENPRVVITPFVNGLSEAGVTGPSLNGRLYLAANMEKGPKGGDPRVASVEFISWNSLRRKFDFGVIENMGDEPELKVVEGGKCFSCHKNKGPILSAAPWTNTTHFPLLRNMVAERFKLAEVGTPAAGKRERIDGMALAFPDGLMVDAVVRLGALLRLNRDTFRLMNQSDGGRKAFVAMLVAIAQPGALDPNEGQSKAALDQWGREQSYLRFTKDWVEVTKSTGTGILVDQSHFPKGNFALWSGKLQPIPTPPPGGFSTPGQAKAHEAKVQMAQKNNEAILKALAAQAKIIATYDETRAEGKHGLPSAALPSNPKAFVQPPAKATQKPAGMVNPVMLAATIGLTEGDRKFIAEALADGAKRLTKQKVTTATLAKQVFEGPEFADVLAGGPLPDRDDFKDRFVAGLNTVLTVKHQLPTGFAPERREYASGPKRDPKAVDEIEAAVVPTSACLRCHDVRASGKARAFESIPALHFDPFDKQGRTDWARTADPKRKAEVLARLIERLHTDADMPPQDAPEHDTFRVKQAAAFDDVKRFLNTELEKARRP
jgi:nitrate reductase cytochrome c-type subunit